jgi:hypothetical protein
MPAIPLKQDAINPSARTDDLECFELSDVEVETLRRAASERGMLFDANRRTYTRADLLSFGMVREGYTRDEMRQRGFGPTPVCCFDDAAKRAEDLLTVDTPFGDGVRKWQLPVDMLPMRVLITVFPPGTNVACHVHPPHTEDAPGGGLRIVSKGRIFFQDKEFGPGDWFFVPNGTPYEFYTDPDVETIVFYKYAFFGFEQGNRFSHPHAV